MVDSFVDVWLGEIMIDSIIVNQQNLAYLSEAEQIKAKTFKQPTLQQHYIKIRLILRQVLAKYLNQSVDRVVIHTAKYGKPFVEGLFFNLSHTHNQWAIVVSNVDEVGIDIEQIKIRHSLVGLVDKCFATEERHYWQGLSDVQKITQFYQFWVRKEAFVKTTGRGIALGLNQCVINPLQRQQFLRVPHNYGGASDWVIHTVHLDDNQYCGAVVVKNHVFHYQQYNYNDL